MKTRCFTMFVLLVLALLLITGCQAASQSDNEQVIVTDLLGREVSIPAAIERVVALGPGTLRLLAYAGNLDFVVGVEQMDADSPTGKPYMLANPDLAILPVIGQGGPNNAPDPEKILTVSPDVIFTTYAFEPATADELQSITGIPVVVLSYGGSGFGTTAIFDQTVQNSILLVGQICGTMGKAQAAVDFILQAQQDLEARTKDIPESERPTVYVGGLGSRGTHGIESTQGQYALLDVIYARNVVDEIGESGSIMIDREMLLEWNPDFIFIDQGGFAAVLEDYQKNPTFYESLSAVQNSQIYTQLPYNYYNTNIGTAIADAYYLGKILYPDAFADVDPVQKADEIYQALLGQPVYIQMAAAFGGFGPLVLSDQ